MILPCKLLNDVLGQQGNVVRSSPKRRQLDRDHVHTVVQVFPKAMLGNQHGGVVIRRRNDSNVSLNSVFAADSLKLTTLQRTQELGL